MTMDVAYILTKGRQPFRALRSHLVADRAQDEPHRIVEDASAGHRRRRRPGRRGGARDRAVATRSTARCGTRCGRTSCSPPRMTSSHRRAYVDWARGIAVLLMIEAHTRRRVDAPERRRHTVRVSRRDGPRRLRRAAVSLARRPRGGARGDARGRAHAAAAAPRSRRSAAAASRSSSSRFCSACRGSSSRPAAIR